MSDSQPLPAWSSEIAALYQSGAHSQFMLFGNVDDRMVLPLGPGAALGSLKDFLIEILMPRFDVVLSYDVGNGIRIERGGELFSQWPAFKKDADLPREPGPAIRTLTHYFRYCANLGRVGQAHVQIGCFIQAAHLVAPALQGAFHYEVSSLALLVRDWATDTLLTGHPLATFLITENINDLNPLIVNNTRTASVRVPLPSPQEITGGLTLLSTTCQKALQNYSGRLDYPARQLAGSTLAAVESLLKTQEFRGEPIQDRDLAALKKTLVENDAHGLIEFIESTRSLDDIEGHEAIRQWLREDVALWKQGDLGALPMGYLFCGPVGTGKTFLVECLAGEAGVPVVKLKNFRDKWVGSSEGNLERIFRLLHALGRCYVFVDEADQALGRRNQGTGDSGVSGRLYSMMAEEMSQAANRGRIVWVLASSRPDLIEVDLKRPGRIDVKMPLLPNFGAQSCFTLLRSLCAKNGLEIPGTAFVELEARLPTQLTPAAAETLAVKTYRTVRTQGVQPVAALKDSLEEYRPPVSPETMDFQIQLSINESTDPGFIPIHVRDKYAEL